MKIWILLIFVLCSCSKLYNIVPHADQQFKIDKQTLSKITKNHYEILKKVGLSDCSVSYVERDEETFKYRFGYLCKQKYQVGFKCIQSELSREGKILAQKIVCPI